MHRGLSSHRWAQTWISVGLLGVCAILTTWSIVAWAWEPLWMATFFGLLGAGSCKTAWADWMEYRAPGLPGGCHCRECRPELHD